MFSLKLTDSGSGGGRPAQGLGRGLLGRVLGSLSAIVVVLALDAYVLDHAIERHVLRNDLSVTRALQSALASVRR